MKSSSKNYYYGLDHLRALAAFLVFFWHVIHRMGIEPSFVPNNPFARFLEEGYGGVSLFICISGFIFTVLTYGREIDYFSFLRNRFLRLFPLLFLVTLFGVSADNVEKDALFLFFNLLGGGVAYGSWTLAVEFQFYIAYPFIRSRLLYSSALKTVLSCGALISLFLFFRGAYYISKPEHNFQEIAYNTLFGRADQFIFGILAGYFFMRLKNQRTSKVIISAAAAFLVSVLAIVLGYAWFNATGGFYNRPSYPSPSFVWAIYTTVEGALWSTLILAYCLLTLRWTGRVTRIFAYLGEISYSTYLLHILAFRLIYAAYKHYAQVTLSHDMFTNQALVAVLLIYPFTLFISSLSHRFIETPFLWRRHSYLGTR